MELKHKAELNLTNGMCPHCSFTWERVYVIKENTCEVDSLKVQCQFSTTEYFHHSPHHFGQYRPIFKTPAVLGGLYASVWFAINWFAFKTQNNYDDSWNDEILIMIDGPESSQEA